MGSAHGLSPAAHGVFSTENGGKKAPRPRGAGDGAETGTAAYYPDYGVLLRRAYSSRSFYLADDGLHWFYPMYSVAPAAEGIVDFSLPYGEAGPLLPAEEEKG